MHDQGRPRRNNDDFKRQTHPPVITETVTARAQNKGITLMPDRRQECAGSTYCHRH